jgi:hypothetical protein
VSIGIAMLLAEREFQGKPVVLSHLVRLARFFVGRFFCLGVLFAIVFLSACFTLGRAFGVEFDHLPESLPRSFELKITTAAKLGLTFVTPALAYTTGSVVKALDIGLGMIAETWPRSALYVLCPLLPLNLLNWIFPVGSAPVRVAVTAIVTLTGLGRQGRHRVVLSSRARSLW